jgi:hypothetical protein
MIAPCPLKSVGGLVYIEARINGSNPVPVVLDTGASVSVVSPSLARRLRLGTASSIQAAGPGRGGDETMPLAADVTIDIGPIQVTGQTIAILPLDYIAIQAGHATDGIISVGAFAPQVVEVDYRAKRVRFIEAPGFSPSPESVEVPVVIGGNVPLVRAEIGLPGGGIAAGTFVLDSGTAHTAILFSKPFIGRHPELLQTSKLIDLPRVEAVGGKMEVQAGRIAFLRIGSFTFKDPIAKFARNGAGVLDNPRIDGTIGTGILERFCVAYDYSHSRIFLTPEIPADRAFDGDASGLRLVTVPPDFHRFKVEGIADHSPGAEADIKLGDILTAIDGKRAANLTLSQIREMLELPDRVYSLSIEREKLRLTVHLKTRQML